MNREKRAMPCQFVYPAYFALSARDGLARVRRAGACDHAGHADNWSAPRKVAAPRRLWGLPGEQSVSSR